MRVCACVSQKSFDTLRYVIRFFVVAVVVVFGKPTKDLKLTVSNKVRKTKRIELN